MSLIVLIGGARSGKTSYAVEAGRRFQTTNDLPVTYVATAAGSDTEMTERIERHQAERPVGWATVEERFDLVATLEEVPTGMVIVDCLTLWTTNMMLAGHSDAHIHEHASLAATVAADRAGPVVVVTNEVGFGIVPDNELARRFRDTHGWVNQTWAKVAQTSLCLVAGRAMVLDDPWVHLDGAIS